MKVKLLQIVTLITLALSVSSCSVDHREDQRSGITSPSDGNETEWTILYYGAGNYAGDMLPSGQSQTVATVQGLQDVSTTPQVHAVALVGTETDAGHCRLYDISFRPGDAGNQINSASGDWGIQDMSSPALLKQFVDSATALHPARHYALVIGGKGEAWRGACQDDGNGGRMMPIPEIYQSLDVNQNGLPVHFDVFLWLTPGMNTLEVAYEMRDKADYMVATSSILPQPGFLATGQWLLDLSLDPGMNARRLGEFMLSRMQEKAQAAHDTLSTFNLLDLRAVGSLAQDVSAMADSIGATLRGHSSQLLQVWQSLWDLQTSDSSTIDLPAFVNAIRQNSFFYSQPGVQQTADRVQTAVDQVMIDRRSTRQGSLRTGLTIYSPMTPSPDDLAAYGTLLLSQNDPGWASLLAAMQQSGSSLVQVRGTVRWVGHDLTDTAHPLYLFVNTAQVGQPAIMLVAPLTLTDVSRQDSVAYQTSFAVDNDSATAYIGVFQDLNPDQNLSSGDQFGYYHHNPTPLRDWLTIHSGDVMDSVFVTLTAHQN